MTAPEHDQWDHMEDPRRILGRVGRHTDYCALRVPGHEHDCDCGLIAAIESGWTAAAVWWLDNGPRRAGAT